MSLPIAAMLSIFAVAAVVSTCTTTDVLPPSPAAPTEAERLRSAAIESCKVSIESRTSAFKDHVANGRLFQAVDAIGNCAALIGNTLLESEVNAAHIQALTKASTNKSVSAEERLRSMAVMERLFPAAAKPLLRLKTALEREAFAEATKKRTAEAKATAAKKRREGVRVGMSEQDVLDSSWGHPRKVNRTTRASGVSEQWVYDGGYLYFDNGILTAIQN